MMQTLKNFIIELYNIIVLSIKRWFDSWFNRDKHSEDNEDLFYDDFDDLFVNPNEPQVFNKEVVKPKTINYLTRFIKKQNKSIVKINIFHERLPLQLAAWNKTETNHQINVVVDGTVAVLKPSITFMNNKVELATNHVLERLPFEELDAFIHLNPDIAVKFKQKPQKEIRQVYWTRVANADAVIYTKDTELKDHYIITTKVSDVIKVPIKVNGRQTFVVGYILIKLVEEINMIWSGSLVMVDDKAYVITASTSYNVDQYKVLFAVALTTHDYSYEIAI